MQRRAGRELALKIIFQADVGRIELEQAISLTLQICKCSAAAVEFGCMLARGAWSNRERIDQEITRVTFDWDLNRMANVDRNILRVATYELLFIEEIPPKVSINEAIELAKKYGTEESGRFVNGVLGGILKASAKGGGAHSSGGGE